MEVEITEETPTSTRGYYSTYNWVDLDQTNMAVTMDAMMKERGVNTELSFRLTNIHTI